MVALLDDTWTTGLVVLKEGVIVCEEYFRGNDEASQVISWSVAKSFVSALIGIAVEEGHIKDIHEPETSQFASKEQLPFEAAAVVSRFGKHIRRLPEPPPHSPASRFRAS